MTSKTTAVGTSVLLLGNVAGMVDLVALPLWISGLMKSMSLDPQQAGLQVTLYILGVFLASVVLAPRFHRVTPGLTATLGFAIATLGFAVLRESPTAGWALSLAHLAAGIGAGTGLSSVHGTVGRSANPHRVFAIVSFGVGLFAIPFFVVVPALMAHGGVKALFTVLGALMFAACVMSALAFPRLPPVVADAGQTVKPAIRLSPLAARGVTLAFVGVALMATAQAMAFSFVDRLGAHLGFAADMVARVFIIGGFINFFAPVVAGLLQKKLKAPHAAIGALLCHAALTATAMTSTTYLPFALASMCFVFFIIFGHTFMFGLIARLDPSGRASASTPAMLMIGSAIGPVLGGSLVKWVGYPALGISSAALAIAGAACFWLIARSHAGDAVEAPLTSPQPG